MNRNSRCTNSLQEAGIIETWQTLTVMRSVWKEIDKHPRKNLRRSKKNQPERHLWFKKNRAQLFPRMYMSTGPKPVSDLRRENKLCKSTLAKEQS